VKEQPLVSIIIPTYNRAHLLGETLDSILEQTYQNWECIVIDDGSSDTTAETVETYLKRDSRFQFFSRPNEKPKGANACRNFGFEKSKGVYIQWFDSDDLMHPQKISIKINYALSFKADAMVSTHSTVKAIAIPEELPITVFESSEFYVDFILGKKPVITDDVLVRREVVGSHRFDENLHKAQEYEFFTRLFEQPLKYCFMDVPLTIYRETQKSISKATSMGNPQQVESLIYLSKLLRERHKNNPKLVERAERLGRKMYKSLLKRKEFKNVWKHYTYFRQVHHKSTFSFPFYLIYNFTTGRGFDIIKPKKQ
jgi:glycosyltransferase involved in cell wall biosynthesis